MPISLQALQQRVDELERLADEVLALAEGLRRGKPVQPDLSNNGQRWYRGARELLVQQQFSGLPEFDACYDTSKRPDAVRPGGRRFRTPDIENYIGATSQIMPGSFEAFSSEFQKARALARSVIDEVASRALPLQTQLSLAVAASELDAAGELLANWGAHEPILRAAGVVARVALERHVFTLAETKNVTIQKNPPSKSKADAQDVLVSLEKAGVITSIQRSQLESLFKVGNNCAHPKEQVIEADVRRLITEGKQLASVLV